jgi:hypothetical protein
VEEYCFTLSLRKFGQQARPHRLAFVGALPLMQTTQPTLAWIPLEVLIKRRNNKWIQPKPNGTN